MSKMDVGSPSAGLDHNPRVCRCIPLGEVDNPVLLEGLALWQGQAGARKFPAREEITPRMLKPLLRYTTLLKVIGGGSDYEYRIVGDAYVMAHGLSFQGKLWSGLGDLSPGFQAFIKPVYDRVVRDGTPIATRGWIERGGASTGHVFCEYVYLPLGSETVDHILAFAVYLRRDGLDHLDTNSFTL